MNVAAAKHSSPAGGEDDRVEIDKPAEPTAPDLLRMLAPDGPWNVRTITSVGDGDKKPSPQLPQKLGYHLGPANVDDRENGLLGWIAAAAAGRHNCYLHVAVGPDESQSSLRAIWSARAPCGSTSTRTQSGLMNHVLPYLPPWSPSSRRSRA